MTAHMTLKGLKGNMMFKDNQQSKFILCSFGLPNKFIVLIHNLSNKIKFEKFQKWDIIIKQGYPNEKVYIMIDGLAEVINELKDYEYLDINFLSKTLKN